jgi:arsenate reductase (thioredoxin)
MSRSIVVSLATVVAIVSGTPVFASQTEARTPVVLFMCPHGAAKSVMASAYFQTLAKERGLNVRVDAAGTDPEPTLSKGVVAHLQKNNYAVPIEKPRPATAADMSTADVVSW